MIYRFNFIVLLVCVLNNISLFGQVDCKLLNQAFCNGYFVSEFVICKMDSTVLIFDKKELVGDCYLNPVCGKSLRITKDSIYNLSPEKYSSYKPNHLVVLYDYLNKGKKHTLRLWRPYTGASISLTYKKKRGNYKLIKHSIGAF